MNFIIIFSKFANPSEFGISGICGSEVDQTEIGRTLIWKNLNKISTEINRFNKMTNRRSSEVHESVQD